DAIRAGGRESTRTRFEETARGWQIQPPTNQGGDRDHAALLSELTVVRDNIARLSDRPFVFLLETSEKLIASEDHQPLVDRKTVTLLKHAGDRAAVYTTGAFLGLRNALVLTASKLGQIPPWLSRDNAALHLFTGPR